MLKFKQSDWINIYIGFNTKERTRAAKIYEKNFYKFMINTIYGKNMEYLRKRINDGLVNNVKYYLKYVSKPTCIYQGIFDKLKMMLLFTIVNRF